MSDYDAAYRRAHPRLFPYSPWERQKELSDLWPSEQKKFRDVVDAAREEWGRRERSFPPFTRQTWDQGTNLAKSCAILKALEAA